MRNNDQKVGRAPPPPFDRPMQSTRFRTLRSPSLQARSERVQFYFNFFFFDIVVVLFRKRHRQRSRGTRWYRRHRGRDRPTSSASSLRLISKMRARARPPKNNRTPLATRMRDRRRVTRFGSVEGSPGE